MGAEKAKLRLQVLIFIGLMLSACSVAPMFPAEVTRDVAPEFDFKDWKRQSDQQWRASALPRKVRLGGEILNVERKANGLLILADNLPIVEHPKYGPKRVKRSLDSMFAIHFRMISDSTWLQRGNFFVVVGKPDSVIPVAVDDTVKSEPYLIAQCIHIWKNQGRDIASFPFETGAGYYPLEEETFCDAIS